MATYPALAVSSTLQTSPQKITKSRFGKEFGFGSTGTLIAQVDGGTGVPYPLRPEAGAVIAASTADTIGNYGKYSASSTAVSPVFTVADPVPGCELDLVLRANPSTAIKFVTASSNVLFGSSAGNFSLTIGSSLFFDKHSLTLVGMSTGAYQVKAWYSQTGSTILPTATT